MHHKNDLFLIAHLLGRNGAGGVAPARVAGLLIWLDRFGWAAVYGGLWIC